MISPASLLAGPEISFVRHFLIDYIRGRGGTCMNDKMRTPSILLGLILIVGAVVSCRMVESLTGNKNAGTVSSLWPDVPPFAGAKKADLQIPLGARLALRAMMQGKINFIAFTSDQGAEDVKNFYTNERMKASGWTPSEKGCVGDTEGEKNTGAVCFYQRKDGGKPEGLAIIIAQDEKKKETDIFYARIDLSQPTPSPTK
jgi:hypothetical protein